MSDVLYEWYWVINVISSLCLYNSKTMSVLYDVELWNMASNPDALSNSVSCHDVFNMTGSSPLSDVLKNYQHKWKPAVVKCDYYIGVVEIPGILWVAFLEAPHHWEYMFFFHHLAVVNIRRAQNHRTWRILKQVSPVSHTFWVVPPPSNSGNEGL